MATNVLRLEMSYFTSNAMIDKFNYYCCSWGQMKTPKDSRSNIRGGPAPLWANPSITFFRVLFVICLMCSLLFVGSYVGLQFYKGTLTTSGTSSSSNTNKTKRLIVNLSNLNPTKNSTSFDYSSINSSFRMMNFRFLNTNDFTNSSYIFNKFEENSLFDDGFRNDNQLYYNITKNYAFQTTASTSSVGSSISEKACFDKAYSSLNTSFIVIGGGILFINAIYYLIISYVDYASDQEWSRYLVLTLIFWLFLVGFIIGDFLYFLNINSAAENDLKTYFEQAPKCKQYFDINIYINLIVPIICILIAVLCLLKLIHLAKKFFISGYVEHSAKCFDDNIVIV